MLKSEDLQSKEEKQVLGYLTQYTIYKGQKIALRSILKAYFTKVKQEKGQTLKAIGIELAKLMNKGEPYTESYLSRLLNIETLPTGWGKGAVSYDLFLNALGMDEEGKVSVWSIIQTLRHLERGLEDPKAKIEPMGRDEYKYTETVAAFFFISGMVLGIVLFMLLEWFFS